jgi:hypothetical protein
MENDNPTEIRVLPPRKAMREKCIDCVGGRQNNPGYLKRIRDCEITRCTLNPHRMGKRPKQPGAQPAGISEWSCLAKKDDLEEQQ